MKKTELIFGLLSIIAIGLNGTRKISGEKIVLLPKKSTIGKRINELFFTTGIITIF